LSYTEDFSNGVWGKSGATVTANDTLAPNGTMTADKIVFGAANNYIIQGYAQYNLGNCSHSIYVKGTPGETIHIDDGYIAIPNVVLTGNWQRIDWVSNRGSGQNQGIGIGTYNGATARTIYLWGAQLELGSTATTYQPIATTPQAYIASQFKFNLKDPRDLDAAYRLVFNGGWTFDKTGATPNGTNGFANTYLTPSSVLSLNSASIGAYLRTDNVGNYCDIGSANLSTYVNGLYLFYNVVTNKDYSRNNNIAGSGGTTTASNGFIVNKRTTSNDMKTIRNNSLTLTNVSATTGLSTSPIYISAMNHGGTSELFSNRQTAFNFISDGLTDTEAANLYTAVQAFQTALSRQV
jgi:hypothetical protein